MRLGRIARNHDDGVGLRDRVDTPLDTSQEERIDMKLRTTTSRAAAILAAAALATSLAACGSSDDGDATGLLHR